MRADRLMNIMILLQNRGKMTAKELADELEVSERTILRDMDALTHAGIPIVSERGKAGGWRLMDHFRSRLSGLTSADMTSLFLSPSKELLEDLGLHHSLDTRQKLFGAIPDTYRDEAQAMWEKIHIDSGTWKPSNEKNHALTVVKQALWENKELFIRYGRTEGDMKERIVEPLGLVAKGGTWYLVATRNGEIRNYRVSRIGQASLEEETFERPPHFHLPDYWEQSKASFVKNLPAYEVDVWLHPRIVGRITFTGKFVKVMKKEQPTDDGWIPATLQFNDEQEAIEFILGFSDQIRVESPHLKEKILTAAQAVIAFYQDKPFHTE